MAIKYQGSTVLTQLITLVKTALKGKSDTSHKHTKSQITDMPTRLSQFVNDVGFKTTDTTYGLATTNTNGLMSYSDKSKLNGIAYGANNYSHPTNHPASIIITDSNHRFVTDSQLDKLNSLASTTKTISIYSYDWQNGEYTLYDSLITAISNQEFIEPVANDSNKAMREMLRNAQLVDAGQGNGWAKIKCEGTVPTSTVQVRVIFRGEK